MDRHVRAERVRQLRARGWTFQRIADELGTTTTTVSRDLGGKDGKKGKRKRRTASSPAPRTIDAMLAEMTADERRRLAIRILTSRTADAPASRGALDF